MTVSQDVRLLIMVLGENHYDMMSTTIFRRERIEAASFLGYSLKAEGWGLGLSSSTRAQERPQPWQLGCILAECSVDSCVRLLVKQDILIKVESVFMSTFGCFILSEQSFTSNQEQIY